MAAEPSSFLVKLLQAAILIIVVVAAFAAVKLDAVERVLAWRRARKQAHELETKSTFCFVCCCPKLCFQVSVTLSWTIG